MSGAAHGTHDTRGPCAAAWRSGRRRARVARRLARFAAVPRAARPRASARAMTACAVARRASAVRFAGGLRYTWIAKLRRLPPPTSPKRAASGAARLR
ncbi:hypothetical protein AQ802_30415 [Burkholderia pseudomallei]|uniref:hypothetical protein n=1 Tax=Burkholderia pseudomallei TaxID=28450 RepID=UPI0001631BCC|nr:hypothetical protein [Burkholderia pseudomallei]OAB19766.1 hypothetical protein AQ853_11935 [Burkholderia pseudomallei]OMT46452.1 hypothetical protein AQ759_08675 [Burkholderia pseudomallei]OMT58652.1 hypothetical protein AQ761_04260 [Burkholderia pseudomallei]OMU48888.1 hypothetical protein AQ776_29830 [Burkholderia pseudomallei]OMU69263.1 hypothetical protein AQ779_03175 [Burkholderia pseudomallei]